MEVESVELLPDVDRWIDVVRGEARTGDVTDDRAPSVSTQIRRALNVVKETADGRERQVEASSRDNGRNPKRQHHGRNTPKRRTPACGSRQAVRRRIVITKKHGRISAGSIPQEKGPGQAGAVCERPLSDALDTAG